MKKQLLKKLWLTVFSSLTMLLLTTGSAFAETDAPAPDAIGIPPVDITFSRDSVQSGQTVDVTVSLDNNTLSELQNVTIDADLPEGLTVVKGSNSKTYTAITSSQTVSYTFTAKAGMDNGIISTNVANGNPGTGTPAGSALAAAAILAVLLLGAILYKRRFSGRRTLSIVLCFLLSMEAFSLTGTQKAMAEEAELPISDFTYTAEDQLNLCGTEAVVTANVHIGQTLESELPTSEIISSDIVASGASVCHFVLSAKSDTFTQDFDSLVSGAHHMNLSGSFEDMTVSGLSRSDNHEAIDVTLSGTVKEDAGPGIVLFNDTSLENNPTTLAALVQTGTPSPAFVIDQCSANNGSLTLAFTMDSAEFSDGAAAGDFSFRDYNGNAIDGLTITDLVIPSTEARKDGRVVLTINGKTSAGALFNAIDDSTMTIGENATNCGPLELYFDLTDRSATVTTVLTDYALQDNHDGSSTLTGNYEAVVSLDDGNTAPISLSSEDLTLDVCDIKGYSISDPTANGGPNFSFNIQTSVPTEAEVTLEDYLDYLYVLPYALDVTIENNKLTDTYGIPLLQTTFDLMPAGQSAESANNSRSAQSSAFKYTQTVVNSLSKVTSGNFLGALGDLLGLGTGDKSVMNALSELQEQNHDLQSRIENLATQMANQQAQSDASNDILTYYKNLDSLSTVISNVDCSGYIIQLAQISDKNSAEYRALNDKIVNILTTRLGNDQGINIFIQATMNLGRMICNTSIGNPVTKNLLLDDYTTLINQQYNWDPETFASKQDFLASIVSKYNDAFMICQVYINDYNAKNPDKRDAYSFETNYLPQQAKDVAQYFNSQEAALSPRSDGKILNLVNGQAYGQNTFSDFSIHDYMKSAGKYKYPSSVDDVSFSSDTSSLGNPTDNNSTICKMVKRLPKAGYRNLYDELKGVGFTKFNNQYIYYGNYSRSMHHKRAGLVEDDQFTANYYDLKNNKLVQNGSIGHYRMAYWAAKGWRTSVDEATPLVRFNPNH